MRFLFNFYDLQQKAGIQRNICELSNALVSGGDEVTIISKTNRNAVAYALDERVSLIQFVHPEPEGMTVFRWALKASWGLRQWRFVSRVIRQVKPSIVVDHGTALGLLYPFRTMADLPFVLLRNFPVTAFPNGPVIHKCLSYFKKSGIIVAVTESLGSELRSYGHSNIHVIPNIVPVAAHPSEYLHQEPKVGLLVGRANPQKGFDIFLEALALKEVPGWRFIIVGPGVDRDQLLIKLVRKYALQDIVSLLPASANPYEYIRRASCVIMPSRYEGLPLVALESLSIGRPLIAADTDGLRDIVIDGVNGRLFPTGDVRKLSACLVNTCRDEQKLAEFAGNASSSLEKFRAKSVVDAWKKIVSQYSADNARHSSEQSRRRVGIGTHPHVATGDTER